MWNIRREILLKLDVDQQKDRAQKELQVTQKCLQSNPKSYSCWFQRQWILKFLKDKFDLNLYQNELLLCKKYLGSANNESLFLNSSNIFDFRNG